MAEETRTILITGVTRGLGRSLALRLAGLGHVVIGCGRTASAIEEVQRLLGEPHALSIVDVASAAEVETWARRVLARHPPIDLLINNAGVINVNAPLWEVPEEELSRVIDINLKGTAHVIRAFLPSMLDRGRGVVVNFSSGWGKSTSAEVAPYCATKWGIEGMTKALAEELPAGLAAVALNPGVVHTAMLESCYGQSAKSYPGPERWAGRAAPFLLGLGPKDNGKSLTVPGF
ncbi:MAG TPA: SDR family NAD(P)-dependent oxidoreductase [Thermoanaerobaculia bacterium]|nr:SDR family NAD(P)-dependent oxidoreductase [Thermoanaerobaculia bacterium]